jgi:hypothetical protein
MQTNYSGAPKDGKRMAESMRWMNIGIRTLHIGVASIFFGGAFFSVSSDGLSAWYHLTVLSGCGLLALEVLHDSKWPHRGEGLLGMAHICLAIGAYFSLDLRPFLLWAIVITGCIGSHMPGRYRHWSIIYGFEKKDA